MGTHCAQRLCQPPWVTDYQRIYQVIYSLLETSGIAATHGARVFFASVGTFLLRED